MNQRWQYDVDSMLIWCWPKSRRYFNAYRPWDQTNLVLNSKEKLKPVFLLSLMCMFPWCVFFRLQWTKGGTWRWILTNFQIQKGILQTVRAQKLDAKNGVICLVSFFLSWVMVLKLPKIVHFLEICANVSKKSKSIKAIYLYRSERPHHGLSGNSMFHGESEQQFTSYWGTKY